MDDAVGDLFTAIVPGRVGCNCHYTNSNPVRRSPPASGVPLTAQTAFRSVVGTAEQWLSVNLIREDPGGRRAFGAYNWRRLRPQLGTPSATTALTKSAAIELSLAALVLGITSVLVALPLEPRATPHEGFGHGAARKLYFVHDARARIASGSLRDRRQSQPPNLPSDAGLGRHSSPLPARAQLRKRAFLSKDGTRC